jgi:hypothetical protein
MGASGMKKILAAAAALLMLAIAGCNYTKPVMYVNLANNSGEALRNVELKYPTGIFGLPELRNGLTNSRMVPMGEPCSFAVFFEDVRGAEHKQTFELGAKCPVEVQFDVAPGFSISERTLRR